MGLTKQEIGWLCKILQKVEFFSICTIGEIEDLLKIAIRKQFGKGSKIVKQGDKGDFFFIIAKGSVSVYAKGTSGGEHKIKTLPEGGFFGETSLVEKKPRNSTVIADNPCDLFLFYSGDFINLLAKNKTLQERFHEIIKQRTIEREEILQKPKLLKFLIKLFGKKS